MKINNKIIILCFLLFCITLSFNTVYADSPITGQTTITTPGKYYLDNNISAPDGLAISIQSDDVIIDGKGFAIKGNMEYRCIDVNPVKKIKNITIKNFNIFNSKSAISVNNVENLTIMNNNISSNNFGICLTSSNNNTFVNNNISSNDYYGIYVFASDNNTFINNNLNSNIYRGIYLEYAHENTLVNNTVNSNTRKGIHLKNSYRNTLVNNTVNSNNERGIYLVYSNDNTIMNNSICLNTDEGIYLDDSHNNSIYHNVFNNSKNVVIRNYNNDYWNTTNEKGGGNYWFTPNGTGFSETHPDNNGDGFCDDPYPIATDNIDYLPRLIDTTGPIMAVHSPANKSVLNVSRFIVNVTAVDASGVDKIMTELNNWNNTLMEYSNFYYMSYGGISDGNHSLAFYAFDNLGHKSVKKLYFVIDTTAPNVTINSPNGTLKTSKILINVSSSDDTSGIKEVIANINNENIILTKTGDYYVAEKPLNDGTYLLNVKSTDNANNSNSTSVNITIDTYVPSNNNNNNRHGKIDASTNIDSKSLRRTVSDSAIVYGSSFDKQLAENLKENIHSDDYRIDRDTIIIGGPISNRIANQYNDRFSISVTNDNPGENRGIIQVISIPSGSSTVVQNYKLIYIAGSDRLGTEAALKYFETLTELPEEPIVVEWTSSGYKVVN